MKALAIALLGVLLILAGATFDTPSLYVPGAALLLLAGGAVAWVRLAAYGARLERDPGPPTVIEDEPYPLRVRLRTGLLRPPGGELLEPLLGWPVPIGGRWSRRIRINVRFSRRGRRVLEPGEVIVRDPFGIHELTLHGEGGEELLVLPRVEPVRTARAGGASAVGLDPGLGMDQANAGRRLDGASAELEVDGLRPYREGAPATRIHWPAVARTGEMVERRLVADMDSAPLVVLDSSRPDSEGALDAAVRAAGSLCLHLARAGGCALLLPGERRPLELSADLGGWPHAHARLALVQAAAPPPPPAPRAGAVFWVTGTRGQPRVLERLAAPAGYLVSPFPPSGARAVFAVAGCTGVSLRRARTRARAA